MPMRGSGSWFLVLCAALGCHRESDVVAEIALGAAASASRREATVGPSPAARPSGMACSGCLSIERCERGQCVPACPPGEVYVPRTPADGFLLAPGDSVDGGPGTRVVLSKPFCLDETEVTVADYRRCVDERGCSLPELRDLNSNYRYGTERERHPVNLVNWDQAQYFCQSLDKDLPTESEWKWAAGHGDDRRYPWGDDDPTCENGLADFTPGGAPKRTPAGDVGCHGGGTSEVRRHPKGKSSWPTGDLYDLGGNVWEWTRDCYLPLPEGSLVDPSPQIHPLLKDRCFVRSLVGGGWNRSREALKIFFRAGSRHTYRVPGLGFRCLREGR